MKYKFFAALAVCAALVFAACNSEKDTQHFAKAEDFGRIDSAPLDYLQAIRSFAGTNELHSLMVLKDGKKLLEYYDVAYGPDFLNICWSASKTFTATALGFAVQDGLVKVEDKLVDILPAEMLPEAVSDTLRALNLYDLLRMASGLYDNIGNIGSGLEKHPTKTGLSKGFQFFPGEKYKYCSFNTYLLSVVVQTVTGKTVEDYLKEKLFEPLGIRQYYWDKCAEGYNTGGWGLYMTTEGLAKMGQFFLQDGVWNGKQLLNKEWLDEARKAQIYQEGVLPENPNDKNIGYGYQMWVCTHDAYRLDGARGQWVIVCPNKNAVIVITETVLNTSKAIECVWPTIYDKI